MKKKAKRQKHVSPPLNTIRKGAYSSTEFHDKFNLTDLQEYCKLHSMRTSGPKKDIIKRIQKFLETGKVEEAKTLKRKKKGNGKTKNKKRKKNSSSKSSESSSSSSSSSSDDESEERKKEEERKEKEEERKEKKAAKKLEKEKKKEQKKSKMEIEENGEKNHGGEDHVKSISEKEEKENILVPVDIPQNDKPQTE